MPNKDSDAHSELLDSLRHRIETERSLLQRRLERHPPRVERPARKAGALRPRYTGRLYQVFLALSVPEET